MAITSLITVSVNRRSQSFAAPEEIPDALDDLAGSIGVLDGSPHGFGRLHQIARGGMKPAQGRLAIGDDGGEWLIQFVGDRRGHFTHGGDTHDSRRPSLALTSAASVSTCR